MALCEATPVPHLWNLWNYIPLHSLLLLILPSRNFHPHHQEYCNHHHQPMIHVISNESSLSSIIFFFGQKSNAKYKFWKMYGIEQKKYLQIRKDFKIDFCWIYLFPWCIWACLTNLIASQNNLLSEKWFLHISLIKTTIWVNW